MKCEIKHKTLDIKQFSKEDLRYIDPENLSETIVRFTIPIKGDNDFETYTNIANLLKCEYSIPIKYLSPVVETFSYIAQKSALPPNSKNIEDASALVEPLNQNLLQKISYTPINQMIPLNSVFEISAEIPYEGIPVRKLLTSASLKSISDLSKKILEEAKNNKIKNPTTNLFNRRISYGSLDIGSKLYAKFIVKTSDLYSSMSLFRFRRPENNVIEFIYYDHLCIDMRYILTKIIEIKSELKSFCEEMIKAFEKVY